MILVCICALCVIFKKTSYNFGVVMSATCTSYESAEKDFVRGFTCPAPQSDSRAVFCCGFNDVKYCCDDPNSFFPYEYGYMWWLSFGALVGLSIAAVVLLVFLITVCVLCYLFISTKPGHMDNGLTLNVPENYRETLGVKYVGSVRKS